MELYSEIGLLVARCHEARAEGSALEVAQSIVELRAAAVFSGPDAIVSELVKACAAGAEQRLCAEVDKAATKACDRADNDLEST